MGKVKIREVALSVLIFAFAGLVIFPVRPNTMLFLFDLTGIALIWFIVFSTKELQFSHLETSLVVSLLAISKFYLPMMNPQSERFSSGNLLMLMLLIILWFVCKLRPKQAADKNIVITAASIFATVVYGIYQMTAKHCYNFYFSMTVRYDWGYLEKFIYFTLFSVIILVVLCFGIKLAICFSVVQLKMLQETCAKHKEIGRSALFVLTITFVCLILTEKLPVIASLFVKAFPDIVWETDYTIQILWIGTIAAIILIQIIYIRLLYKTILLKEEMKLQEGEWQALTLYNHELENNMQNLKDVRHDLKNIFLTMGGYVEQSGNEQMKVFYQKNIVPFAQQELQKSDLYSKMRDIHDEGMKSFLYFKMMQGIEQNVQMNLEIAFEKDSSGISMSQTDLIRILGILIDNAAEEAAACSGSVTIQIKENCKELDFAIRNSVRKETQEKGVIAGTTTKGLCRGNGLIIADKIIQKYTNVVLNSFFQGEEFVQYLKIEKLLKN